LLFNTDKNNGPPFKKARYFYEKEKTT
jgi:hypothetical protein